LKAVARIYLASVTNDWILFQAWFAKNMLILLCADWPCIILNIHDWGSRRTFGSGRLYCISKILPRWKMLMYWILSVIRTNRTGIYIRLIRIDGLSLELSWTSYGTYIILHILGLWHLTDHREAPANSSYTAGVGLLRTHWGLSRTSYCATLH